MITKILKKQSVWITSLIIITIIIIAVGYYDHKIHTQPTIVSHSPATLVTLGTVQKRTIPLQFSTIGTVISPKTVMLKAQQAGIITGIYFHSGEKINKGQLLLQIDDTKQKAALAQAQANLFSLEADYQRNLQIAKNDQAIVSPNTLDQKLGAVKAAQAQVTKAKDDLLETQVRAPFTGQIGALESINNSTTVSGALFSQNTQVTIGGYLAKGDNIVILTDPNNTLIQYQLPQEYSANMAIGQQVQINRAQNTNSQLLKGKVNYISPTLLTDSHAYLARATVHARPDQLKPGMAVMLTQTLQAHRQILAVPGLSLVPSLTGFSVYVVENHKVKAIPVQTGNRYDTWVAINKGLKSGDKVIASGLTDIHPGSLVKVTHTV